MPSAAADSSMVRPPQLDQPGLLRVERGQLVQGVVHRQHVDRALVAGDQSLVQRHAVDVAAPLLRGAGPRRLDQDLSHRHGGDADHLGARPPVLLPVLQQSDVRLVDERRRLQGERPPLAAEVPARQPPQLVVDQRHQLGERRAVLPADTLGQRAHAVAGRIAHATGAVHATHMTRRGTRRGAARRRGARRARTAALTVPPLPARRAGRAARWRPPPPRPASLRAPRASRRRAPARRPRRRSSRPGRRPG